MKQLLKQVRGHVGKPSAATGKLIFSENILIVENLILSTR